MMQVEGNADRLVKKVDLPAPYEMASNPIIGGCLPLREVIEWRLSIGMRFVRR